MPNSQIQNFHAHDLIYHQANLLLLFGNFRKSFHSFREFPGSFQMTTARNFSKLFDVLRETYWKLFHCNRRSTDDAAPSEMSV